MLLDSGFRGLLNQERLGPCQCCRWWMAVHEGEPKTSHTHIADGVAENGRSLTDKLRNFFYVKLTELKTELKAKIYNLNVYKSSWGLLGF